MNEQEIMKEMKKVAKKTKEKYNLTVGKMKKFEKNDEFPEGKEWDELMNKINGLLKYYSEKYESACELEENEKLAEGLVKMYASFRAFKYIGDLLEKLDEDCKKADGKEEVLSKIRKNISKEIDLVKLKKQVAKQKMRTKYGILVGDGQTLLEKIEDELNNSSSTGTGNYEVKTPFGMVKIKKDGDKISVDGMVDLKEIAKVADGLDTERQEELLDCLIKYIKDNKSVKKAKGEQEDLDDILKELKVKNLDWSRSIDNNSQGVLAKLSAALLFANTTGIAHSVVQKWNISMLEAMKKNLGAKNVFMKTLAGEKIQRKESGKTITEEHRALYNALSKENDVKILLKGSIPVEFVLEKSGKNGEYNEYQSIIEAMKEIEKFKLIEKKEYVGKRWLGNYAKIVLFDKKEYALGWTASRLSSSQHDEQTAEMNVVRAGKILEKIRKGNDKPEKFVERLKNLLIILDNVYNKGGKITLTKDMLKKESLWALYLSASSKNRNVIKVENIPEAYKDAREKLLEMREVLLDDATRVEFGKN